MTGRCQLIIILSIFTSLVYASSDSPFFTKHFHKHDLKFRAATERREKTRKLYDRKKLTLKIGLSPSTLATESQKSDIFIAKKMKWPVTGAFRVGKKFNLSNNNNEVSVWKCQQNSLHNCTDAPDRLSFFRRRRFNKSTMSNKCTFSCYRATL